MAVFFVCNIFCCVKINPNGTLCASNLFEIGLKQYYQASLSISLTKEAKLSYRL